jgi:hypothetical protein
MERLTLKRSVSNSLDETAVRALWADILTAVQGMAVELLGRSYDDYPGARLPQQTLRRVQQRSVASLDALLEVLPEAGAFWSSFAGPHHLATLLLSASETMQAAAVVTTPTPLGIQPNAWKAYLRRLAIRRPLLWPNHLAAISDGYLAPGVSSVVSFPTGAGKSTLAELKIAAALHLGKSVVFLAPTHALVWQVRKSLKVAFPNSRVSDFLGGDGIYSELFSSETPDIAVMTPERCLTLANMAPESFQNVGLVVFDECHLLHPDEGGGRRGLDAMLCLLALLELAPASDVLLLSAMMSNAQEIADWLKKLIERQCLSLTLDWKPTRQTRACVVYSQKRLDELGRLLQEERRKRETRSPSSRVVANLTAVPMAVFGLRQTWASVETEHYAQLRLLDEPIQLSASKWWRLSANKNVVAAQLASRMAEQGIKTLIFVQNKAHCEATAQVVDDSWHGERAPLSLTADESALRASAIEDLGG